MSLNDMKKEFFDNVWDHRSDPFQMKFDERGKLSSKELKKISKMVHVIQTCKNDEQVATVLTELVLDPSLDLLAVIIQISGLTRNKILSDLRCSPEIREQGLSVPARYDRLPMSKVWRYAASYLVDRLKRVLQPLLLVENIEAALESINQATYPGYIRQERAKRQGHEAEYRLAVLLSNCGIPFQPQEKTENPLCSDAQIHGISFDLVVGSVSSPLVVVKSTVHTASLGQYGESKDDLEMDKARGVLEEHFPPESRPVLFALIDGIGFKGNPAGLRGVLEKSDEFCQFKTIWKAIVVCCAKIGRYLRIELPKETIRRHKKFLEKYSYGRFVKQIDLSKSLTRVEAGEGYIILP